MTEGLLSAFSTEPGDDDFRNKAEPNKSEKMRATRSEKSDSH